MRSDKKIKNMVTAGMLCAIGILIPMVSPIKITLDPASFTLASHVPVFMAMFISPVVGIFVAVGTTLGFLMGGFPLPVVARAASHVIFVLLGAAYLTKHKETLSCTKKWVAFSFVISVIHGVCELLIILPFYINGALPAANYEKGFFVSIFLLVGIGSVVHSMVDFVISQVLWSRIGKAVGVTV